MAAESSVFDEDALETARVFFAHPVTFLMGAVAIAGLPSPDLPEVAFAGRSNVGKSSLINGLVGRHGLARASNEPSSQTNGSAWSTCRDTASRGCRGRPPPTSRIWAGPICAGGRT
jgi:hypothetical protein